MKGLFVPFPFHLSLISSLLAIFLTPSDHIWYIPKLKSIKKMNAEYILTALPITPKTNVYVSALGIANIVIQIPDVTIACKLVNSKKRTKYLTFLYPTQFPTHGQWWSWTSTQTPQVPQWKERGGLIILQVPQKLSLLCLFFGSLYKTPF